MTAATFVVLLVFVIMGLSLFAGLLIWVALLAVGSGRKAKLWRNDDQMFIGEWES